MNWNIVLYIGLVFYILIILYCSLQMRWTKEKKIGNNLSDQLTKSFEEGKNNGR